MPTADDCFRNAGGAFTRDLYDVVRGEPDPTAALRRRQAELSNQRRQVGLQAIALHKLEQQARSHSHGIDTGLASILSRDIWGEGLGTNIEFRARAIMADAYAQWADGMSKFRSRAAGLVQDKEGLRDMVRALFGDTTGDPELTRLAELWSKTVDNLRDRFNKAGGMIGKLADWGLPQYHDPKRVAKFGNGSSMAEKRTDWKNFIRPLLDRDKMLNDNGARLSDVEFEVALDAAHTRIVTDGLSDLAPGANGGKKLANKRADHRFFKFKDGDAWLKYHDAFGHQDIYTTMTDHIMSMSHDIAMLETMGPNPEASFRYLRDLVKKEFAPGGNMSDSGKSGALRLQYLDSLWNVVSGKIGMSPNPTISDISNSVRHVLIAAKLGGAFLSAMSDLTFQAMTRKFNGLPAMGMVRQMVSQMNPANEADRLFAVKLGLGADAWLNHSMVANRFGDVFGANMAAKISDFTMRASLLSSWTDAGRKAFGLEFTSFMAAKRGMAWGDLGASKQTRAFRRALKRGGITPEEWDLFRGMSPMTYKGAEYLRPADIIEQAGDIGMSSQAANDLTAKYLGLIHTEMDFAVPSPDARVRAITTMGEASGTTPGEIARHLFLFKSFPITVLMTHFTRAMTQQGTASKASYAATAMIATTVLGALAIQAKEVSRGKDPRPMTGHKFWLAALTQGGGAGIAGDFLFSEENRFGQDPLTTFLGPTAGLIGDASSLVLDNAKGAIYSGKDVHFASDVARFAKQYTPGSSVWYARLALERGIFDQLDLLADEGRTRKAYRRMLRKRRKEYGQNYWWKPGELTPQRAPDIENIGD